MTVKYDDLANLVDNIRNARYGEMVRHTETLIESGDWREFITPAGFNHQFLACEFDYFLLTVDVDPTTLRHAYLYASDIDNLSAKQVHLADITGKGKTPPKNARRSLTEIVAALAGETSGAVSRIQAGGRFVTNLTGKMASDPQRRQDAKRNKPVLRDSGQRWDVRWSDDRTPAQAIVDKLLKDEMLARDVYKRLHAEHMRATRSVDKRRSTG